ncbi:TonB-dependent receptor [Niabella yanshanensis]|uniref:TonB-dependent receptor n=1 Tax=Niabella yanshanensis TaxID=577386 RepID=A0ABZ0WCT4_9BACT|nr:TonB-dependent receptor [Niabella yanshanensis]WQD40256.1 TonB-dependent receptor [Niabella yanshanensis]
MKFFLMLCCVVVCITAHTQSRRIIVTVSDDNHLPVTGASIELKNAAAGVSDSTGRYIFRQVSPGPYEAKVSMQGYKTVIKTGVLKNTDVSLIIRLHPESHTLQEVVVQNNSITTRKKEAMLNMDIVKAGFIQQHLGGSLMQSLQRLPGVKTIGIGSGQSKPLIRGLGFNRVVVLDRGIKHEGQQWGADHGLEIDQFAVQEVEILKGPASFAYGSDAIAGAVNIRRPPLPAPHSFGGDVNLIGKTNNDLLGTSVNMYYRTKKWMTAARFTIQDYGDYKVPADRLYIYDFAVDLYQNYLRNTAGRETGIHFSTGYTGNRLKSIFYLSNIYSKTGFFANAHGLEPRQVDAPMHDAGSRDILSPYQRVNHLKILNHTTYTLNDHQLELETGFQNNLRQEYNHYVNHGYMPAIYPDSLNIPRNLERAFDKNVYSLNLRDHIKIGNHQLETGINGEIQNNTINGWSFLVPAFNQQNLGAYVYDKWRVSEKLLLHGAMRYDHVHLAMKKYTDWFPSASTVNGTAEKEYLVRADNINRSFNSVTGSLGINYNTNRWELKGNIGKSFRVPIAKELGANGVNYHYFSYEKGYAQLKPEESYQLDLGTAYDNSIVRVQFNPFFNYFPNYIYLNPTAGHDYFYGAGNQIFEYAQARVMRYGGELQVKYQPWENLSAEVLGEYIYAKQLSGDKKGYTLPFSPPASVLFNVTYQPVHTGILTNTYLSVDYRITAAQNNIVPPEKKTEGYNLLNIQAGTSFPLQGQKIEVSLQLQNVLDAKYLSHTSFYRLIGLPEQGRNLVLSLRIPFSFKPAVHP